VPPGYGLRRYCDGTVRPVLPWLQSHDLWRHPMLASSGGTSLRADLLELAAAAPTILNQLDELPQALPHGDASPQNLLVPLTAPDTSSQSTSLSNAHLQSGSTLPNYS
jgi:hypothetical protein